MQFQKFAMKLYKYYPHINLWGLLGKKKKILPGRDANQLSHCSQNDVFSVWQLAPYLQNPSALWKMT